MSTSLFSQTFRHNGSAVFGTMPPMCRSCPDVNKLRGMDTTILGQHRPFMSIKSFVQHSGWQEMVSLCSLIRLIGVCADRDQPEFLCSRLDSRHLEVHVATAGGWLTRYRPREVRNSIYRYRKIHIDYRSKFLYRFISPISIIYGNTIYLHSQLNTWLQWIGQRQHQDETRNIYVLGLGASYIRELTIILSYTQTFYLQSVTDGTFWTPHHRTRRMNSLSLCVLVSGMYPLTMLTDWHMSQGK